jgi:hypothetical protein
MKKTFRLGAVAAAAILLFSATPAAAVPYNAACAVNGQSSFTAVKRGWYLYAWRTGTTANGGGLVYLQAGETKTLTTPGAVTSSSKFGVATSTSMTYAYILCS